MSTEIIKLNSLKSNLQSYFHGLLHKFKTNKNYDITLVIQQNQEQQNLSNPDIDNQSIPRSNKDKPSVNFNDNALVLNQQPSQESCHFISMSDIIAEQHPFQSEQNIPSNKLLNITNSLKIKHNPFTQHKENATSKHHQQISNYTQTEPPTPNPSRTDIKMESSINVDLDKLYSVRVNHIDPESDSAEGEGSDDDSDSNAGFLIEKHLNQALTMIEQHRINDLEDFLYNYKEKYSFINIRTQTKWSLLMAHCKQSKLEFERAATNYSQVIDNLKEYPHMMMIDLGSIYNKLGKCYYEIRLWNKGVAAFTEALNHFKSSKKITEYANCMISLGALYLEVSYFVEAEKCFLAAYDIKRHQGDKSNRSNLLPVLFQLLECNLAFKNYQQAEQILSLIKEIIDGQEGVEKISLIVYNIKQAKLFFFQGKLDATFRCCQQALALLIENKFESYEYGQVLEMMGLLKQERGEYNKSKEYFERALKAIQKFISIDNSKIAILKKRIDSLNKLTNQNNVRSLRKRAEAANEDSVVQSEGNSSCFDLNFYQE